MKKQLLSLFLVLCLTLALLPVLPVGAARADINPQANVDLDECIEYPVENGTLYFDDTTGTVVRVTDTATAVDVPAEIEGVAVTTIYEQAFFGCEALKSVTLPDSLTEIGNNAFSGCISLESVTIPNSVTAIGEGVFQKCSGLTAVKLPEHLTEIPEIAFYKCGALKSVTIPDSVTKIGDSAFGYCTSLESVTLSNSLTVLEDYAFVYCESLRTVVIPASVTAIEEFVFGWCSSLRSVFFVGNAPSIRGNAFYRDNLSIYFVRGTTGWGSSQWSEYSTGAWDGKNEAALPPLFSDVPDSAWFAGAVDYAVKNGLMNGMGNDAFQPNTSMTRAMLVTVLWRYAKEPQRGANTFSDVPAGKYYTEAVAWAAANGIVNGVGNGKFNPDGNITREQLVTILYRYCKQLDIDTSKADALTGFPDAGTVGNSAQEAMRWAVAEKLIGGKTLDASQTLYLQPKGSATRAEVATILMRFIENILKK